MGSRTETVSADRTALAAAAAESSRHNAGEHPFVWNGKPCSLVVTDWGAELSVEGEIVGRAEFPKTTRFGTSFQNLDRSVSGTLWAYVGGEVSMNFNTDKMWIDVHVWRDASGTFSVHAVPDQEGAPRVPESELTAYKDRFAFSH